VTIAEVLGATGTGTANKFVVLTGQTGSSVSGANGWFQFGNRGTTYTGFAATAVPNFLNVGDNVQISSVLTEAADPDATINSDPLPSNLNGVTLPSTVVFDTQTVPEPGVWSLLAAGAAAWLASRRWSRAQNLSKFYNPAARKFLPAGIFFGVLHLAFMPHFHKLPGLLRATSGSIWRKISSGSAGRVSTI